MPILDHFHAPLGVQRMWQAFHNAWASTIARHLNRYILPEAYFAAPTAQFGARVEIDVGTFETWPVQYSAAGAKATVTAATEPATLTAKMATYLQQGIALAQDQRIVLP